MPRLNGSIKTMMIGTIEVLLAFGPPPGGSGQQSTAPGWWSMMPLILMIFVFYFVFIRPQQRKAKEHDALIKGIRRGDKIVTNSGIVATVVTVNDKTVSIRSSDTKLEVLKTAIAEISERGSSPEASESKS